MKTLGRKFGHWVLKRGAGRPAAVRFDVWLDELMPLCFVPERKGWRFEGEVSEALTELISADCPSRAESAAH